MSGPGETTITIAATRRCHSATPRHRHARHSVSPIPTMRAQQGRRDATVGTAEPIELIERPADIVFAASVPKSGAMPTSAAIWSRCDRIRSAPASRRQRGGRAKDRHLQRKRPPTEAAYREQHDRRTVQSRRPSKEALRLRISGLHRVGFYKPSRGRSICSGGRPPCLLRHVAHLQWRSA